MALNYLEARRETTGAPGTDTAAAAAFAAKTCFLPVLSFDPDPQASPLSRDDEARALNEPVAFDMESFSPQWSLEMRMYPDSLAFLMAGISAPTTVAGDGVITDLGAVVVPAGAYRHRWTPPFSVGALPKTLAFRAAYVEEGLFYDVRGASVDTIEIATADTGGCVVKASGGANSITPISDPSLTPTYESLAIGPFLKSYTVITTDLASAAKAEDITINFNGPVDHVRTMSGGSKYPDTTEYAEGVPTWTGTIARRRMSSADYAAMLAATRFTLLTTFAHTAIIASSYAYSARLQGSSSAAYTGGKFDALANQRRTPASYDFKLSRSSGISNTLEIVNATTAY